MIDLTKAFGKHEDAALRRAYNAALKDFATLVERHGEAVSLSITIFGAGWLAAEHDVPLASVVSTIKMVMDAHSSDDADAGTIQ